MVAQSTTISIPPPYHQSAALDSQVRVVKTDGKIYSVVYKPGQSGCPPTLTSLIRILSELENDVN